MESFLELADIGRCSRRQMTRTDELSFEKLPLLTSRLQRELAVLRLPSVPEMTKRYRVGGLSGLTTTKPVSD